MRCAQFTYLLFYLLPFAYSIYPSVFVQILCSYCVSECQWCFEQIIVSKEYQGNNRVAKKEFSICRWVLEPLVLLPMVGARPLYYKSREQSTETWGISLVSRRLTRLITRITHKISTPSFGEQGFGRSFVFVFVFVECLPVCLYNSFLYFVLFVS